MTRPRDCQEKKKKRNEALPNSGLIERVKLKESEKGDKYPELGREL